MRARDHLGDPGSGAVAAGPAASDPRRLRFVWKTDALGRIVHVDASPFDTVAATLRPAVGTALAETVRGFDPIAAESLAGLLSASGTPLDISVAWPASDSHATVPVSLKGTPWFDASRSFAGFRGFGIIDLGRLTATLSDLGPLSETDPIRPVSAEPNPEPGAATPEPAAWSPEADVVEPRQPWADAKPALLANVVQLRPLTSLRVPIGPEDVSPEPGRIGSVSEVAEEPTASEAPTGPEAPTALEAPTAPEEPADATRLHAPRDELSEHRPDIPVQQGGLEPGHLSSSEQQAFQEIGRTLQSGSAGDLPHAMRADGSAEAVTDEDDHAALHGPDAGLLRNAAGLVDATAAGLLVLRGPALLFANQTVLDVFRYATQAEAESGIGATLASMESRIADGTLQTIDVPGRDSETVRLDARITPVTWSGSTAKLWTLRPAAARPVDPDGSPTSIEETPAPAATISDERDLLDAASEPLALLDGAGRIITLNPAGEQLFGRTRDKLVGDEVLSLLTPESRAAAAAAISDLEGGSPSVSPFSRNVAIQRADGTRLDMTMRASRTRGDKIAVGWYDPAKQRREPMVEPSASDRAERGRQPDLLATLSHQIRTPLNAIIGFAEVMMDERFGPLGNSRYKDYLKDVHASGTQVMNLVNDLLDLSRIESGRHDLDLGAVDINRIIAESVAQAQADAHRARVIVRTSFSPRQPMIMADDGAARQILGNLLSNAVKFNEPGGQVIVSTTTSEAGTVLVRIRDTGIGMSDRDIEAALEPFRQLEPSRQADATTLGLPLTKALVGANGASLSIRSRPGEGTMVEVTFQPAATPFRVPA